MALCVVSIAVTLPSLLSILFEGEPICFNSSFEYIDILLIKILFLPRQIDMGLQLTVKFYRQEFSQIFFLSILVLECLVWNEKDI